MKFDWMSCPFCGQLLVKVGSYGGLEANGTVAVVSDTSFDGRELDFTPLCLCTEETSLARRAQCDPA